MLTTRADCLAWDAADPLARMRDHFATEAMDREGLIYLDGNSLGALPRSTAARIQRVVGEEWGGGLIRSWNDASWIDLSRKVGDRIAPLIGARGGEVIVGDSTSVNLYKVLSVALDLASTDAPEKRTILLDDGDFPTDLYIADSLAREKGFEVIAMKPEEMAVRLDSRVAVVLLTQVNYRSGHLADMTALNRASHDAGALIVWDLSHSTGALPIDLHGGGDRNAAADFAVGCGYKYLNGGPGAPGYVWAHPAHLERMDREQRWQPLAGWLGHASPFEFRRDYLPKAGIERFLCGTPPILSLAALECGIDVFHQAEELGGVAAIREKSIHLTSLFIDLVEARAEGSGLDLRTPRDAARRGSQVSFAHPTHAYEITQALIARGVIGDFRAPDILRFGFTPLYTRAVDVWNAVEALVDIVRKEEWAEPRFAARRSVT